LAKKDLHLTENFLDFWKSETTRNLVSIWAPFLGYLVLVPCAYKIEQHLRDERGNPQISGFGGNFTVLYSAASITKMAVEAAKGLGISASELAAIFAKK